MNSRGRHREAAADGGAGFQGGWSQSDDHSLRRRRFLARGAAVASGSAQEGTRSVEVLLLRWLPPADRLGEEKGNDVSEGHVQRATVTQQRRNGRTDPAPRRHPFPSSSRRGLTKTAALHHITFSFFLRLRCLDFFFLLWRRG